jgi:hypothetical protein
MNIASRSQSLFQELHLTCHNSSTSLDHLDAAATKELLHKGKGVSTSLHKVSTPLHTSRCLPLHLTIEPSWHNSSDAPSDGVSVHPVLKTSRPTPLYLDPNKSLDRPTVEPNGPPVHPVLLTPAPKPLCLDSISHRIDWRSNQPNLRWWRWGDFLFHCYICVICSRSLLL